MGFDNPSPPHIQTQIRLMRGLAAVGFDERIFDEIPEWQRDVLGPLSRGGASMTINVKLAAPRDVDAAIALASAAGATVTMKPDDMFRGVRFGRKRDQFGHVRAFNAPIAPATMKLS